MNTEWRESALCAQTDPESHYPEAGCSTAPAKRTCMACPVRRDCLEHAIQAEEQHGIWGGVGQQELRRLIRARRAETTAA
ncbi:WhiB family redox-sensing transcriptional regulator [Streptomyces sp. KhCrAH-43]|uniref:WhiB family transcriptional regulator n=1 Tax=unclassified Streptomyces TaxID=2593676 RepID=UPI0003764920|nr:WhiB family transcriptional regulator [Streptomyces sp. KhCrAH-43]RAJ54894.1 WhiB family redox-sensing transcriptional regulator [Streptomyces sp. KhCrAH-43]